MLTDRTLSRGPDQKMKHFLHGLLWMLIGGIVVIIVSPYFPASLQELARQGQQAFQEVISPPKPSPQIDSTPGANPTPTPPSSSLIQRLQERFIPEVEKVVLDEEGQAELVAFALDLINQDRIANGLEPVDLGSNTAAQFHAEDMMEHGYISHWGLNGLKPYMRYTVAGGANYWSGRRTGLRVEFRSHIRSAGGGSVAITLHPGKSWTGSADLVSSSCT
jgi:hypothetical protein